jgi:drug/metabolite transporter (DMT)-like permease
VAINQLGSVLFFLAGVCAYTRPATSTTVNLDVANWGTFLGAVCFAIGGVMQSRENPT